MNFLSAFYFAACCCFVSNARSPSHSLSVDCQLSFHIVFAHVFLCYAICFSASCKHETRIKMPIESRWQYFCKIAYVFVFFFCYFYSVRSCCYRYCTLFLSLNIFNNSQCFIGFLNFSILIGHLFWLLFFLSSKLLHGFFSLSFSLSFLLRHSLACEQKMCVCTFRKFKIECETR